MFRIVMNLKKKKHNNNESFDDESKSSQSVKSLNTIEKTKFITFSLKFGIIAN